MHLLTTFNPTPNVQFLTLSFVRIVRFVCLRRHPAHPLVAYFPTTARLRPNDRPFTSQRPPV